MPGDLRATTLGSVDRKPATWTILWNMEKHRSTESWLSSNSSFRTLVVRASKLEGCFITWCPKAIWSGSHQSKARYMDFLVQSCLKIRTFKMIENKSEKKEKEKVLSSISTYVFNINAIIWQTIYFSTRLNLRLFKFV